MTKLKALAADEQATLNTSIVDNVATCTFTVKPEANGSRFNLLHRYDYTGVSEEEVLALATRSIRIDVQAKWRKAKDKMDAEKWTDKTFMVRDILDESPAKADPVTKALRLADKMTKAERNEYIKKLQAM